MIRSERGAVPRYPKSTPTEILQTHGVAVDGKEARSILDAWDWNVTRDDDRRRWREAAKLVRTLRDKLQAMGIHVDAELAEIEANLRRGVSRDDPKEGKGGRPINAPLRRALERARFYGVPWQGVAALLAVTGRIKGDFPSVCEQVRKEGERAKRGRNPAPSRR